ncbi:MAG: alanine--tRNA ligase [Candidatus Sumerlaeota bacterium]|nr:alanine--tRNA ligase [Candidatus Sumerlaeota bacterium]
MKSYELRQAYVDYFVARGHKHVPSSPVVPPDDSTMLFCSAGMVQFKPLYAGVIDPLPYTRATTVQKCLRAGGKKSDLENVGRTLRHHTFFEMLGNFSFGDYFKREALQWGWDFVWNVMKLPKERLWATTFYEDEEAAEILEKELGFARDRIVPLNEKENFWGPAGDTVACGPCSEIIFFTGSDEALKEACNTSADGARGRKEMESRICDEGDAYFEIWNMVFPQFNQQMDGSRPKLKNRGIDTGAGLERMTTAMQFMATGGKINTPYKTDLLKPIVDAAASALKVNYDDPNYQLGCNAVADHIRALTFALSEGIVPSNEGRGYVLRRILRRALRFAYLMDRDKPFMAGLVDAVVDQMGAYYPEIKENVKHVKHVIQIEEEQFLRTVGRGSQTLDERIQAAKAAGLKALPGADIFELHATHGYPVDMTEEIVRDAGLEIDRAGYEAEMKKHRELAKASWKGAELGVEAELLDDIFESRGATEFLGYDELECDAQVLAIIKDGQRVESASEGEEVKIVLDETPFYANSGGQIGDMGRLTLADGSLFEVADTAKTPSAIFLHVGRVAKGKIAVGAQCRAAIDKARRQAIMRNHTATHVMQAALKQVLGKHVTQRGSEVTPEALRFDFTHSSALKPEEIAEVERLVAENVCADHPVTITVMPQEEAFKTGAIAPFGEKYGASVRVVRVGDWSTEFCGGSHLKASGEIGAFMITGESSIAAGTRRIEAVTGPGAIEWLGRQRAYLREATSVLSAKPDEVPERIVAMQKEIKSLRKDMQQKRQQSAASDIDAILSKVKTIGAAKFLAHKFEGLGMNDLRNTADIVRAKLPGAVAVLASVEEEGKVSLVCLVDKSLTAKIKAGDIIKQVAAICGGSGGGKPDMAQAGGKDASKLDEAFAKAEQLATAALG